MLTTADRCLQCNTPLHRKNKKWCSQSENATCHAAHRKHNRGAMEKRKATRTTSERETVTTTNTIKHTDGRVETARHVHQKIRSEKLELETSVIIAKINKPAKEIIYCKTTFAGKTTLALGKACQWLLGVAPGCMTWPADDPRFQALIARAIPEPLCVLSFFRWSTLRLFYPELFDSIDNDPMATLVLIKAIHRQFAHNTYFPCLPLASHVKILSMSYEVGQQVAEIQLTLECDNSVHLAGIYGVDLMSLMLLEDEKNKAIVTNTTAMLAMTVA